MRAASFSFKGATNQIIRKLGSPSIAAPICTVHVDDIPPLDLCGKIQVHQSLPRFVQSTRTILHHWTFVVRYKPIPGLKLVLSVPTIAEGISSLPQSRSRLDTHLILIYQPCYDGHYLLIRQISSQTVRASNAERSVC